MDSEHAGLHWITRTCLLRLALTAAALALFVGSTDRATGAVAEAPLLVAPDDGVTLKEWPNPQLDLRWVAPRNSTQVHVQVTPFNGDGPSVDLHFGSPKSSYGLLGPPSSYVLLPDMTYTWRVRASDALTAVPLDDPSWSPWAERRFRTPSASSQDTRPRDPLETEAVRTLNPTLQWVNSVSAVFYYELQLSRDPSFNTDPQTASAPVYHELVHAAMTDPPASYTVSSQFPLNEGSTYYWRVRPRVQGDAQPVAWSPAWSFRVDTAAMPRLTVDAIFFGPNEANPTICEIPGATSSFASTPTLTGFHYAFRYQGDGAIVLWDRTNIDGRLNFSGGGRNSLSGPEGCFRGRLWDPTGFQPRAGTGVPGGFIAGEPRRPGTYRLDVWQGGIRVQSSELVVAQAAAPDIGPVHVGTLYGGCGLGGISTTFLTGTPRLIYRFTTVGTGVFSLRLLRNGSGVASATGLFQGPVGCIDIEWAPLGGAPAGEYQLETSLDGRLVQTTTFSVR